MSKVDLGSDWTIYDCNRNSCALALAQEFPVNHQGTNRITGENTRIQSKKSSIYGGKRAVARGDRGGFFGADRGVHGVVDVEADLGQIEAEKVHVDLEAADLFCDLGVLDAVFKRLEILSS